MLFLSELETGRAVVALTSTRVAPIVQEVLAECGGKMHVALDAKLGRATLLRLPLAES